MFSPVTASLTLAAWKIVFFSSKFPVAAKKDFASQKPELTLQFIFFDGEEALVKYGSDDNYKKTPYIFTRYHIIHIALIKQSSWTSTDSLYGSRALAKAWEKKVWQFCTLWKIGFWYCWLFVMVHLKEYRNHARKISFKICLIFFVWQTYQQNGVLGNFLDRSLLNHKIYSFLFLIKDWHFRPSWPGWRWCRAQWDQSRGTILFPKNGIFNWWQWSMPYNY